MKKTLAVLIGVLMVLGVAGVGNAITWYGTWDPADIRISAGGNWIDEHSVSLVNFNPLTDRITSAYALVTVYDDSSDSAEYARINFTTAGVDGATWEVDGTSTIPEIVRVNIRDGLWGLSDGTTPFSLWATSGDFYFASIQYVAEGTSTASVPEPTSLLLLGLGLVGLAGWRRKK